MTVEQKVFDAHLKVFNGEGRGTAVLARLGVRDKDGDVLVPGLLGGEQRVPLIQSHDWTIPAFGRAIVRERGSEMLADFVLNLDTPRGKEWAAVLAFDLAQPGGPIQQWSWGFSVLPGGSEVGTHEGERARFLRRVQLHEVSPVIVGASIGSRTLSLKDDVAAEVLRLMSLATAGSILTTLTRGKRLERMLDTPPPTEAERQAMADAVASVKRTLDRRYLPASSHRPTTGLPAYFAKAALLTELGRLRGWSERELKGVLAQL